MPVILERKFIKHGTSVLGLAKTFARHLVHEEAAEKNLRFESDRIDVDPETDSQAGVADGDALCDTNVKLFLERSVPILSLHRGINAKSRVLLNALATELGLSDEQVEQAIAATQFRTNTSREDADALQEERLVGFRELVQGRADQFATQAADVRRRRKLATSRCRTSRDHPGPSGKCHS